MAIVSDLVPDPCGIRIDLAPLDPDSDPGSQNSVQKGKHWVN